jgi:hypothetical protein
MGGSWGILYFGFWIGTAGGCLAAGLAPRVVGTRSARREDTWNAEAPYNVQMYTILPRPSANVKSVLINDDALLFSSGTAETPRADVRIYELTSERFARRKWMLRSPTNQAKIRAT